MKLVVGDYLEVAGTFDGVCMVDSSFQRLTETYPSVVNTVQQYFEKYGKRVFNCGGGNGIPRIIFVPLDDAIVARKSCQQLKDLADKLEFKSILVPKPWNYDSIQGILECLDDRFILISDDANDIPVMQTSTPIVKMAEQVAESISEPMQSVKVLECSSAGDKRFSAMYAVVEYMGIEDTIEKHYQKSKRFISGENYIAMDNAEGKKVDACEVFGCLYEPSILTMFYSWLWCKYFNSHPELLEYAKGFDKFNDRFKGQSINCQADIIEKLCTNPNEVYEIISPICELENNWLIAVSANAPNELPFGIEETAPTETVEDFGFNEEVEDTIDYKPVTVCVTGHRPSGLWGYNSSPKYAQLQNKIYQCVQYFHSQYNVTRFISGGAQGVDQLFFSVVDFFKKNEANGIENIVYQPFVGQEITWKEKNSMFSQEDYNVMIDNATDVVVCDESFVIKKGMTKPERDIYRGKIYGALMGRNSCMVRDSNYVIGIYSGDINLISNNAEANGGTLDCLRKAYKEGRGIVVIHPETLETTRINM